MARSKRRVSGSWSADEIRAGAALMRALLAGTDVRVMTRAPAVQSFARAVLRMDERAGRAATNTKRTRLAKSRNAILALLINAGPTRRVDIAQRIGIAPRYTSDLLAELRERGEAETVGVAADTRWQATAIARTA